MGLNEYAVLNQVWSGNTHAQQIAEATRFHPQLVKACLVRLQRANVLEYAHGYRPASIKQEKPKKQMKGEHVIKPRKSRKIPIHIKIYESLKRGNNTNRMICADLNIRIEKIAPAMSVLRKEGMVNTMLTGTRFKRYEAI
jgi:hypothetical protein